MSDSDHSKATSVLNDDYVLSRIHLSCPTTNHFEFPITIFGIVTQIQNFRVIFDSSFFLPSSIQSGA